MWVGLLKYIKIKWIYNIYFCCSHFVCIFKTWIKDWVERPKLFSFSNLKTVFEKLLARQTLLISNRRQLYILTKHYDIIVKIWSSVRWGSFVSLLNIFALLYLLNFYLTLKQIILMIQKTRAISMCIHFVKLVSSLLRNAV